MNLRISTVFLILYVVLLLLSLCLLSVPGDYWFWYVIMAVVTVIPIRAGSRRQSILGLICLAFSIALIISDVVEGKEYNDRRLKLKRPAVSDRPGV